MQITLSAAPIGKKDGWNTELFHVDVVNEKVSENDTTRDRISDNPDSKQSFNLQKSLLSCEYFQWSLYILCIKMHDVSEAVSVSNIIKKERLPILWDSSP